MNSVTLTMHSTFLPGFDWRECPGCNLSTALRTGRRFGIGVGQLPLTERRIVRSATELTLAWMPCQQADRRSRALALFSGKHTLCPHLGDGRWWDTEVRKWRSDRGKVIVVRGVFALGAVRTTYVVLACAHLDHDPANSDPGNLAALCQRCHMIHDAAEHRWQRWFNAFRLRALRDLYEDPWVTRERARR
jgi:hypothetical protein